MSGHIIKLNTSSHQAAQELLPWFVTNTLSPEETAFVRAHLLTCSQCRTDVNRQRMLQAAQPQPGAAPDVEVALARLRPRLDAARQRPARLALPALLSNVLAPHAHWLRWVVVGQTAVIAMLAVLLLPPDTGNALYRGLGMRHSAAGNIVVMFKPDTTERELRAILQESGARLVDGPTATDAYILDVPNGQQNRALGLLRSQRAVALAEPLDSGGGR